MKMRPAPLPEKCITPASVVTTGQSEDHPPRLWLVERHVGPYDATLYIGNGQAARDGALLGAHGITSALNVAVNLPPSPVTLPDGMLVRHSHVGLIEGSGNTLPHLMAAILALGGLLTQASPGPADYPDHRPGNILVHCLAGRCRSVTVVALFLHLALSDRYPTLKHAFDHLRAIRGQGGELPCGPLWQLAVQCLGSNLGHCLKAALPA
ncbi:dual specificity protein phosphatase family protein [Martelella alba]|uniref:Dual specificity protein phosphatase family protein n=1 Tax=Martelella alba TaxID=2590451 RepID=A0ABY2SLU5_9HYPH|nr:dual specificity protein phosphatase [Martelella alba]TKI05797.1 dual specificity protein phosphatase family protein [Martelella alba]